MYSAWNPFRTPKSPTGRMSRRPQWNIANMSTDHRPAPHGPSQTHSFQWLLSHTAADANACKRKELYVLSLSTHCTGNGSVRETKIPSAEEHTDALDCSQHLVQLLITHCCTTSQGITNMICIILRVGCAQSAGSCGSIEATAQVLKLQVPRSYR